VIEDPRLYAPERATLLEVLADLDEIERVRCLVVLRGMELQYRRCASFDLTMLPQMWSIAHDRAIEQVATARAAGLLNGKAEWDERTWKAPPPPPPSK
jgi:hypothetical protein